VARGGVRVVIAAGLFADRVRVPMNDLRLLLLDTCAAELFMDANPRDRVASPVEPWEILHDREVHRDKDPGL